jgi:predicted acetyltransferase
MSDPYPIRPVSPEEFDAFHVVNEESFLGRAPSERRRAALLRQIEFDRVLVAFDAELPVGVTGDWPLRLSLPGGMAAAAGVTLVGVLPSHRRRGIVSSLMRRQLAEIRERGDAIAVLWASEAPIYGRYGYGVATWQTAYRFRRGEGVLQSSASSPASGASPGLRLRLAAAAAVRGELDKVYQTVLPGQPGMFARDDAWWDRVLGANDEPGGGGGDLLRCVLAEDDGGPRGYAIYTGNLAWDDETFLAAGSLHVKELVAADPAAAGLLWGDMLSRDLVAEITASLRPVDDPLIHMLADPRRARRTVGDGLWVRLTDVPAALALRRYAAPVDVVIEVTDGVLPGNAGRWRLVAGGSSGASGSSSAGGFAGTCGPADGGADLVLDVGVLGAAYLGGTRLGELARAGLVTERRAGAVAALSVAMSWEPGPWCPLIF